MEHLPLILLAVWTVILLALLLKLHTMRKGIREILRALEEKLAADTNTLIDLSTREPSLCRLAAGLNVQLRILREQRRRYQNGDRELKEAVANISHDLRTPLTAICGYLDLLEREPLRENAARYVRLIANRAEAMKHLAEELQRYSSILSPGELEREPVCLNDVLEESIAALYGAFLARGIQPEIQIPQQRIVRQLNRDALGRIFGNLLSNALKYSDGDLEIRLQEDGEMRFSNQAAGLDEVQVGRLFDRFFTLEAARNSSGLGLSIAKALTQQLGGEIGADWQAGRLTIRVRFP